LINCDSLVPAIRAIDAVLVLSYPFSENSFLAARRSRVREGVSWWVIQPLTSTLNSGDSSKASTWRTFYSPGW
jgi:hypothetical protein